MESYVEQNLSKNETIIKKAELSPFALVSAWIYGILFFWLFLIPTIKAIIKTVEFSHIELAVTNKRIVGKTGILNTKTLDAPLNKIQNVGESRTFGGKIFNYSSVTINTAARAFRFDDIKDAAAFKNTVLAQIDQYENDKITEQAKQMASAMANAIKN